MSAVSGNNEKPLRALIADAAPEELQSCMRTFARELAAEISSAGPERSVEALSALIAELALSAADQRRQQEHRQKQAQGIAAAQARGVRFGRPSPPLPDSFDTCRLAWREGEMSLSEAASACGMHKTTFKNAVLRREQLPDRTA